MNLLETAELFWRQMFPEPSDESALKKDEIIATAKQIYAYSVWEQSMNLRSAGEFEIPSAIIEDADLVVTNKEADISGLDIQKGFPLDTWAISLKGGCRYIKSTANTVGMIDADELSAKRYLIKGNKITFPDGTNDTKVKFTYAGMGVNMNGEIVISDEQGHIIRQRLAETYLGKTGNEDRTNNENANG